MKQEQQKMVNPQVSNNNSAKTGKKKSGKKPAATQSSDQFVINEPVIGQDSALLPSGTNITQSTGSAPAAISQKEKKPTKDKSNAKSQSNATASANKKAANKTGPAAPVEEWVTMGKPKKSGQSSQPSKESQPQQVVKSNKSASTVKKQTNGPSAPSRVHDPETDMLVDNGADNDNDFETSGSSKNTERQQLAKKIKKLKSKFKEAENLKRLSEAGEKLDELQQTKAKKVTEFAKEIQLLQNQLQTLKVQ